MARYPLLATLVLIVGAAVTPAAAQRDKAKNVKVGVVGAGIAGIRAAALLHEAGVDVTVLEADSVIGGRMRQAQFTPYNGAVLPTNEFVEAGANWVQGLQGNPIWDDLINSGKCGPLDGKISNYDSTVSFDEKGQKLDDANIPWDAFDAALECAADTVKTQLESNAYGDVDLRAAYRLCGWDPIKPIDYAVEYFSVNFEWAEAAEMVSSRWTQPANMDTDLAEGDYFVTQQADGGFAKLVSCLVKKSKLPARKILLNTKVTSFDINPLNQVVVTTQNGTTYQFSYVISTIPIGALQRNLATLFPASWFSPAKRAALTQFRMATYTKIFLKFAGQFWDPTAEFFMQAPNNGASNGIIWQSISTDGFLPGSNIIMLTYTDVMAASIEKLEDQVILQHVLGRLKEIYPQANTPGFELLGYVIPRWYTNELFGGSYTNWPAGMPREAFDVWRAPVGTSGSLVIPGKVLFSGEAACKRFNGYVPGGYAAGERSAKQILQAIGKFAGNPDDNICERQLTALGNPIGRKGRGCGRGRRGKSRRRP